MNIKIYYDDIKYRFPGWRKAAVFFEKVIRSENMISGDLCFIITTDERLLKINKEFLNHDYYTDVIAFDYCSEKVLKGEIYISKETVKRNSHNYNVSFKMEMLRVMIHGVLHMAGYRDKTKEQRINMRKIEDKWLTEFFS